MLLYEYFDNCNQGPWITIGKDVQYKLENKVLYLQCSVSKSDWKYNLQFGIVPYKDMEIEFKVHRGFLALWKSIRDEIRKLDFDTIVGYSQGAAIAGFVHEDFIFRKGYEPTSYVFGCPRFLWLPPKKIRGRFTKFLRHKNPRDIVTMVPPVLWGYWNAGPQVTLGGKIKRPKGYNIFLWLSGHSPFEYQQRTCNLV